MTTAGFCYKIFHLPDNPRTAESRKQSFDFLDAELATYFNKLNTPTVEISSAEDYFHFNDEQHLLKPKRSFKWGELGIWASNLLAMKNFMQSDYEYLLLIEDDIDVKDPARFVELLLQYMEELPAEWDFFSYYVPENQIHKFKPAYHPEQTRVVPAYQDWSMLCYVVSQHGAMKLFQDSQKNGLRGPIDHHIFYNPRRYASYTLKPDVERPFTRLQIDSTFQSIQERHQITRQWLQAPIFRSKELEPNKDSLVVASKNLGKDLGNVLVYKTYGGLGDILFAIPAITELSRRSTQLCFAVEARLVGFFSKYLGFQVISEDKAKLLETEFDLVYELGNYPPFKGYEIPHAIFYPSHKNTKQHAIAHYFDALDYAANLQLERRRFPYFKAISLPSKSEKHYVIHPGAGFKLKVWPLENYVQLIHEIKEIYPQLACKVIQGPDDPDIRPFLGDISGVEVVTGDMEAVGLAMEHALFFIGNDAGIMHVAGAFNVPTVAIYGPTGPGTWGSFAEHNTLIWGKKGVCNVRCNYKTVISCKARICLSLIQVERVLESLFELLDMAYSRTEKFIKINPLAKFDFTNKDCLITLRSQEMLMEFEESTFRNSLEKLLLEGVVSSENTSEFESVYELLRKEKVLFECPIF